VLHPIEKAATTRHQWLCGCQDKMTKLAGALQNKKRRAVKKDSNGPEKNAFST
jgi:hypothetical protein